MRIVMINLKYSEALGGFSQETVDRALSGAALLEVREHHYIHHGVPHLNLLCLVDDEPLSGTRPWRPKGEDPAKSLPEALIPLYRGRG